MGPPGCAPDPSNRPSHSVPPPLSLSLPLGAPLSLSHSAPPSLRPLSHSTPPTLRPDGLIHWESGIAMLIQITSCLLVRALTDGHAHTHTHQGLQSAFFYQSVCSRTNPSTHATPTPRGSNRPTDHRLCGATDQQTAGCPTCTPTGSVGGFGEGQASQGARGGRPRLRPR